MSGRARVQRAATLLKRSVVQFYSNPLRTLLTLLGVVFGVGAVVAMMSIGEGAQRQILARIEAMGAKSVHVRAEEVTEAELTTIIDDSLGLSREDARAIAQAVPQAVAVAYRVEHALGVTDMPLPAHEVSVYGISQGVFRAHALKIERGERLSAAAHDRAHRVAVLGATLARRAFGQEDPIGRTIRLDYSYFKIVGVLDAPPGGGAPSGVRSEEREASSSGIFGALSGGGEETAGKAGGGGAAIARDYDEAVLIPFSVLESDLAPAKTYHEVDMISVEVGSTAETLEVKRHVLRLLLALHGGHEDFTIVAPEELLRQRQETQAVFNAVLLAIAAISLLVGGIGVMNIMLANIMERIQEIGLRRAIGAKKRDIRNQFLLESVSICFVGGALGVLLGLGVSALVSAVAGLPMVIAWESTALSFGISLGVGVTFGLMPAMRAANVDPIDALRGE